MLDFKFFFKQVLGVCLLYLLIILILILFSAVLSAAEACIIASSDIVVYARLKRKEPGYDKLHYLHLNVGSFLSFLLCTNTIANFVLGIVSAMMVRDINNNIYLFLISFSIALLVVIFAELVPKSFALKNPEHLGVILSKILLPLFKIFRFATDLMEKISVKVNNLILKVLKQFGYNDNVEKKNAEYVSDEIKNFIDRKHKYLTITNNNPDMIKSILELNNVTVDKILTPIDKLFIIDINLRPNDIVTALIKSPYMRVPVYSGNKKNIIGVLHARKLLRAYFSNKKTFTKLIVEKNMLEPWFVDGKTSLIKQLNYFKKKHQHCAMVVDKNKDIIGLVTLEDVLEHIVGDIYDEIDIKI